MAEKLTVERLQSGEPINALEMLGFMGIELLDIILLAVLLISLFIVFFSLRKIAKHSKIYAFNYIAYGIGLYLIAMLFPIMLGVITWFIPEIFDIFESQITLFGEAITYVCSIGAVILIFIGAIKLKHHANTL